MKYNYYMDKNVKDKKNRMAYVKHQSLFLDVKHELYRFYYNNQYDEDKYPTFRACDEIIETINNGIDVWDDKIYVFYD